MYLRGSDDESDTSHQRFLCLEYAARNGLHVDEADVYDEGGGYSGKKLVRVRFDEMLHRIMEHRDVDAIVLYKFDRALRKIKYLLELKEFCERHGVALISVTQNIDTGTPEGKAFFAIGGAFAEMEWDMASQRIRDAYRHVLAEHGTRPSVSWRAKETPLVSARWGRKPGSKDKQPDGSASPPKPCHRWRP
ncbi:MAG TPA: recombinase family protein [Candidatus Thermoplasmatota archaeon]|nr:recombinase family protein [Candidatus Thermoplasmatota archaeon]HWH07826.1 recombinase family protein [Candidatus Thermoplasmatota archaeon]